MDFVLAILFIVGLVWGIVALTKWEKLWEYIEGDDYGP